MNKGRTNLEEEEGREATDRRPVRRRGEGKNFQDAGSSSSSD
jgi:hypothetical protein